MTTTSEGTIEHLELRLCVFRSIYELGNNLTDLSVQNRVVTDSTEAKELKRTHCGLVNFL